MLTDTVRTTNGHMVSKYTETAYAFLPVPELRDKHTNTHTGTRFFSDPPPAKQSMPCIATSGAPLAAPRGSKQTVQPLELVLPLH